MIGSEKTGNKRGLDSQHPSSRIKQTTADIRGARLFDAGQRRLRKTPMANPETM